MERRATRYVPVVEARPITLQNVWEPHSLLQDLRSLTRHHLAHNPRYRNFVESRFHRWNNESLENLPFLPVSVFKNGVVKSVPEELVVKVMSSSGTSASGKSRIALDRETAMLQARALSYTFASNFGKKRRPMVIVTERTVVGGEDFSASDAAVNGFSSFASSRVTVNAEPDDVEVEKLLHFLESNEAREILFFGFTFNLWAFVNILKRKGVSIAPNTGTVLHGGGWKKLEHAAVTRETFNSAVQTVLGASDVRNYYGMVEQTGTVFIDCAAGNLHAPAMGDAIVRNAQTLEPAPVGAPGLLQVFSSIQKSYPGHSLLTEDLGIRVARCDCGNQASAFRVLGRMKSVDVRGCSDAAA